MEEDKRASELEDEIKEQVDRIRRRVEDPEELWKENQELKARVSWYAERYEPTITELKKLDHEIWEQRKEVRRLNAEVEKWKETAEASHGVMLSSLKVNKRLREALWPVTQLVDIGKKQVDLILGEGFVARCEAALEGKE